MAQPDRYSRTQIGLHWLIFGLFVANYAFSDGMGRALRVLEAGGQPEGLAPWLHLGIGSTVLVLTLLRLALRLRRGVPEPATAAPIWAFAARWGHRALYLLMVLLPLTGLRAWIGADLAAGDIHEVLVNVTLVVILGHAGAALFHHYVLKDGLLSRMRP